MSRITKFALLTMVFVLALTQVAFAGLKAVGPINPVNGTVPLPYGPNGFPQWYTDANGVTVDLPDPPIGAPPPTVVIPTMIFTAVDPAFPYSAQTNFGAEAFYFNATSPKTFQTKWGKVVALMGLEASYANLVPTAGQQNVFARIRLTAPNIQVAGTYTFSHPWGVESIVVTSADLSQNKGKGIKFTRDIGVGASWNPDLVTPVPSPNGFYSVLQAGNTMSTFLTAINPAPPAGWLGDGVNPATFTGSSLATPYNKIRLDAPAGTDLDGRGNSFIESTQLVISAHVPASTTVPLPLSVDRITCSHPNSIENIDFWITSRPGVSVAVKDVSPTSLNPGAPLYSGTVTDPSGKFYATFQGTTKLVAITVTDPTGAFSPTSKTVAVTDYINILMANYSLIGKTVTIQATSSDYFFALKHAQPAPILTVAGLGTMALVDTVNGIYALTAVPPLGLLPPYITVNSNIGGSVTVNTAMVP